MNEESKKKINEKYERTLLKGERFWPDSIFKDVIMSFGIFLLLILLATFLGVHDSPKADPSDTSYVPRPEWYFLFLFKFLALYGQIPVLGKIEFIATIIIPGIAMGLLVLLPFLDKTPYRYYTKRIFPISIMSLLVVSMVTLTLMADIPTTAGEGIYIPGITQVIAGLIVPSAAFIILTLMNFVFKTTSTKVMIWTTVVSAVLMITFTGATLALAPVTEKTEAAVASTLEERIVAGQDLYSVHCVECHGEDGKVTTIEGVEGLEGKAVMAINGKDVLYTLNDATMAEVIAYGRPDAGMNPFGKAYNPEGLAKGEIDYIVTFMRYMWDDRFERPVIKPLFPALAAGEVPSYDVHIAPIVKRYCVSCHRPGKDSNAYLMDTYENITTSGDNAPSIKAGDANSPLLQVIQGTPIPDPDNPGQNLVGVMPPKSTLKADVIDAWMRWVMAGMPRTAEEAAALSTTPTP